MTRIWVPKFKIVEPKKELVLPVTMKGRFKLNVYRPDGRLRKSIGWFDNLIVDAGLNHMGSNSSLFAQCVVGTGSSPPSVSDTALGSLVASTTNITNTTNSAQGSAPYYGYTQNTYRFAQGAAAGNLTEVGIRSGSSGNPLWSRSLILDNGSPQAPTTLTVLSDEFLDVVYEVRVMPPLTDVLSEVNISGSDYDIVTRASSVTAVNWAPGGGFGAGASAGPSSGTAHSGTIGAITGAPTGTSANATTSLSAYSDGSYQRDSTLSWGLTAANFGGGIAAVRYTLGQTTGGGGWGAMQCSFSPTIMKTSSMLLSLVMRHTWTRGEPS